MKITNIIRESHFFIPCGMVGHYLKLAKKSHFNVSELADNLRDDDFSLYATRNLPLAVKAQIVIDIIDFDQSQSSVELMSSAVAFVVGFLGAFQALQLGATSFSGVVAAASFLLALYCMLLYHRRKMTSLLKQTLLVIRASGEQTQHEQPAVSLAQKNTVSASSQAPRSGRPQPRQKTGTRAPDETRMGEASAIDPRRLAPTATGCAGMGSRKK